MSEPFDQMALVGDGVPNLATAIRRRFDSLGGAELEPLPRELLREPPDFNEALGAPKPE